ncbi:MAG: hypothetical protein KME20_10235 [Kaiparowitsia implicata GSE-PSE-MK54-09C]|jgi:hypothetical protein|nr:hypothetical protein [Kaiparowitsia implicata GSE-PSE-MK54-09C]
MRKLPLVALAAALTISTAVFAQAETVAVDLSSISEELSAELGIDVDDLPSSIDLPAALAAEVCGVEVDTIADTCVASVSTDDLVAAINEMDDSNDNSAREFAPGQQEGPANEAAPGQQDGDAKDFAPGQVKKADDGGSESGQGQGDGGSENGQGQGKDSAPGQDKKAGE